MQCCVDLYASACSVPLQSRSDASRSGRSSRLGGSSLGLPARSSDDRSDLDRKSGYRISLKHTKAWKSLPPEQALAVAVAILQEFLHIPNIPIPSEGPLPFRSERPKPLALLPCSMYWAPGAPGNKEKIEKMPHHTLHHVTCTL